MGCKNTLLIEWRGKVQEVFSRIWVYRMILRTAFHKRQQTHSRYISGGLYICAQRCWYMDIYIYGIILGLGHIICIYIYTYIQNITYKYKCIYIYIYIHIYIMYIYTCILIFNELSLYDITCKYQQCCYIAMDGLCPMRSPRKKRCRWAPR